MKALGERTILVVEDSDDDWDTVVQAGRTIGIEQRLSRAVDGSACLDLLRGSRALPLMPVFLLLDLNLPGVHGRDVLLAIKGDRRLKALPVIIVTTSSNPRDVSACYRAGANAYHVKPLRYPAYIQLMHALFDYWLAAAHLPHPSADAETP